MKENQFNVIQRDVLVLSHFSACVSSFFIFRSLGLAGMGIYHRRHDIFGQQFLCNPMSQILFESLILVSVMIH